MEHTKKRYQDQLKENQFALNHLKKVKIRPNKICLKSEYLNFDYEKSSFLKS